LRVLLVEDELEFARPLRAVLEKEGFVVDHAATLDLGEEAAEAGAFDLALLDRMLPDGDGLTLVPLLRVKRPGLPVIVMSARGEVADRVEGLDDGADDYLIKPFALAELLARIRAVRRRPGEIEIDEVRAGHLTFDVINEEAFVHGRRLELPRRELLVLAALVRRHGRTVARDALEQAVYGFDDEVQSNTLDSHVSRLRKKLSETESALEIHPVRGVGYLLRALDE
jgi:DNA-binding response OmpR family regulator